VRQNICNVLGGFVAAIFFSYTSPDQSPFFDSFCAARFEVWRLDFWQVSRPPLGFLPGFALTIMVGVFSPTLLAGPTVAR
jgi:hypothetical protein